MDNAFEIIKEILIQNTSEGEKITVKEIEDHLRRYEVQVSKSSVYNQIQKLKDIGKVEQDKDKYSYCGKRLLEDHDARIICDSIISSRILSQQKTYNLINIISNIVGKSHFDRIISANKEINYLKTRVKTADENIYYLINTVISAIMDNKQISFNMKYYNENKTEVEKRNKDDSLKQYIVSPYTMVWQNDLYYLIGNEDGIDSIKHFRLDRIKNCIMLNYKDIRRITTLKGFEQGLDLKKYIDKCFYMYGKSQNNNEVNVRIKCLISQQVINKFIDKLGTEFNVYTVENSMIINFKAYNSVGLQMWLMELGSLIEVLEPEELRESIKNEISKMYSIYFNY